MFVLKALIASADDYVFVVRHVRFSAELTLFQLKSERTKPHIF